MCVCERGSGGEEGLADHVSPPEQGAGASWGQSLVKPAEKRATRPWREGAVQWRSLSPPVRRQREAGVALHLPRPSWVRAVCTVERPPWASLPLFLCPDLMQASAEEVLAMDEGAESFEKLFAKFADMKGLQAHHSCRIHCSLL